MNHRLSQTINLSRWMAAVLVVLTHTRQIVMLDASKLSRLSVAWRAWYVMTGFAHEAVIVFFVISGFLVGGNSLQRLRQGGFDQRMYWAHRIARIYTVLTPALLIGLLLDRMGLLWKPAMYQSALASTPLEFQHLPANNLSLATLLGNFFGFQTIYVRPLGTNGPLWSLANEWWYYVLFALLAGAWVSRWRALGLLAFALALVVFVLPLKMVLQSSIWAMGASLPALSRRLPNIRPRIGVAAFLVCTFISRLERSHLETSLFGSLALDIAVACGYSALILALLKSERSAWLHGALERANNQLAAFSFSLYAVHYPALIAMVAMISRPGLYVGSTPTLGGVGLVLVFTGLLILYGYVFSLFTERHTSQVRGALERALRQSACNQMIP